MRIRTTEERDRLWKNLCEATRERRVLDVENELHEKGKKSNQAISTIEMGEELSSENVKVLWPGGRETGIHPKFYDENP